MVEIEAGIKSGVQEGRCPLGNSSTQYVASHTCHVDVEFSPETFWPENVLLKDLWTQLKPRETMKCREEYAQNKDWILDTHIQ